MNLINKHKVIKINKIIYKKQKQLDQNLKIKYPSLKINF